MKVCVNDEEDKGKIKFPSLVKGFNGLIVLAGEGNIDEFSGIVLVPGGSNYYIGEIITDWDTTCFTPFNSSITISNK